MRRSVLSICAPLIQKEIEYFAAFTSLEYDINDENTIRVAGTGIFKSIIYANEQQPYSAIEQAKRDKQLIFIKNRSSKICRRCTTNKICTGMAEIVIPLYLNQSYLGSLSVLCYHKTVHEDMLKRPEYYKKLCLHVAETITKIAEAAWLQNTLNLTEKLLSQLVDSVQDPVMLIENRRILQVNPSSASQIQHLGIDRVEPGQPSNVIKGKNGRSIHLNLGGESFQLKARHSSLSSELALGKRLEYIIMEQELLTEQLYFQDKGKNVSLDYFDGISENLIDMKRNALMMAEVSRHFVLEGERGLGKELWVRAILNSGKYAGQELLVYDCNAFSDLSFANQVLDEDSGIFSSRHITVCLKEISRLPYWMQLKLADNAALLEDNDIRLVATSIEDLSALAQSNSFSKRLFSLFYPAILRIPPLRERNQDIEDYIQKHLTSYQEFEKKEITCTPKAMARLKSYSWPGNFKQMEQVLGYLISINTSGVITEDDLARLPNFKEQDDLYNLQELERQTIQQALSRFSGPYGKQAAAKALGISKATLYRKIQEYHLAD